TATGAPVVRRQDQRSCVTGLASTLQSQANNPMPAQDIITKVEIWPVDVPITDPFAVATGRLVTAQNLFVRITLKGGARGYGEIAPFPEVGGADRDTCSRIAAQLAKAALGRPASQNRKI